MSDPLSVPFDADPSRADPPSYGRMSIVELSQRIALGGDRQALDEFHQRRTPFRASDGAKMRLVEFIESLRTDPMRTSRKHNRIPDITLEEAGSLCLDKFINLPDGDTTDRAREPAAGPRRRTRGPDCRNYFRGFLKRMENVRQDLAPLSQIEEERIAAEQFQKHIVKHFGLSLKECLRSTPGASRYHWKTAEGVRITLWMPRWMNGRQRREWLEENIDLDRVDGDRERIQRIVNERLDRGGHLSFNETVTKIPPGSSAPPPWSALRMISNEGLAQYVAHEKTSPPQFDRLRPAVRRLGRAEVRKLVLRIFEDLDCERYQVSEVAHDYGLSLSALSRFAGPRWGRGDRCREAGSIPDLWSNLAQVLASIPVFKEACRQAGLWKDVEHILEKIQTKTDEEVTDG